MNLKEMHIAFRQYAQQMGMQNVRAILPEQIDILINTTISDKVNAIIKEALGVTSDRVVTDNSKIGQTNALRSLYKEENVDFNTIFNPSKKRSYTPYWVSDIDFLRTKTSLIGDDNKPNFLLLCDFELNYKRDNFITDFFPVRIVDDIYLADTINDFVLAPRFRSPVMTVYSNYNAKTFGDAVRFTIYIDKGNYSGSTINLENGLIPNTFSISYIGKPVKVMYREDTGQDNIDCDLPEYMHVDVVKSAVDLYNTVQQGSILSAEAVQRRQATEQARNNYRNAPQERQQSNQ